MSGILSFIFASCEPLNIELHKKIIIINYTLYVQTVLQKILLLKWWSKFWFSPRSLLYWQRQICINFQSYLQQIAQTEFAYIQFTPKTETDIFKFHNRIIFHTVFKLSSLEITLKIKCNIIINTCRIKVDRNKIRVKVNLRFSRIARAYGWMDGNQYFKRSEHVAVVFLKWSLHYRC